MGNQGNLRIGFRGNPHELHSLRASTRLSNFTGALTGWLSRKTTTTNPEHNNLIATINTK
jgi:hypothetical protein